MFVDELRKEISTLDLHPLTKVVLGATWAEPHRIALIDGDLVIGSELDASDVPADFYCEEDHLHLADLDQVVDHLAKMVDEGELAGADELDFDEPAGALSVDQLVSWLVFRQRERQRRRLEQMAFRALLEWLGNCRLAYRDGQWVKGAPWGSETVDTRPL